MQANQRAGQRGLFRDSYFYLSIRILSAFFLFYVKMLTKQDQTVQFVKEIQTNTIKYRTESQTT